MVHGWGDKNDEPWLELWFPDKDPADKNSEDRKDCYGWRRMSMWLDLNGKRLMEPDDPESAEHKKIQENAMKQGASASKKQVPMTPPDTQPQLPLESDTKPEPKPQEPEPEVQLPEADTQPLAPDDDPMVIDEPPAKRSKKE